ncbi:glutathione S-transferase [Xylariaceae sp. FL1651]|nr:glutathione S-transferase [Xylariaceae sp. FL1651]
MTLIVHHLGVSQSDRVVWLCEELGIDYEMKKYDRSPILAPPELKALHPLGAAPVIEDGSVKLAESGACVEYIAQIYGKGQFIIAPGHESYADYLYWFHFANATFQSALVRDLAVKSLGGGSGGAGGGSAILKRFAEKFTAILTMMDDRLAKVPWLAGEQFSAADIMVVCCLTTMRCVNPYELGDYKNILAYLKRVSEREGYRRAMEKGDPELDIALLTGAAPPPLQKGLAAARQATREGSA